MRVLQTIKAATELFKKEKYNVLRDYVKGGSKITVLTGEYVDQHLEDYVKKLEKIVNETQHVEIDLHEIRTMSTTYREFIDWFQTKPEYLCEVHVIYRYNYLIFLITERKKKSYETQIKDPKKIQNS